MKAKLLIGFVALYSTINAQYTKLLDFAGNSNGANPWGTLVFEGTSLFGMAQYGGTDNKGVVFKIQPDGTGYTKLFDFTGASNGSKPQGALISDGTFLYGMTRYGGTNDNGVIFKVKPDGTGYSKLLDFAGVSNGSNPSGSLISDGTFLYGMTIGGGSNNLGVIFKIKQDGTGYSKLLDFTNSDGKYPHGSLTFDGTFLYGMTNAGGTNGSGVAFKIKPDGTGFAKLLDFSGTATGSGPWDSFVSDGTFLYGTTVAGGANGLGVIFKIKPDGTGFAKLLDFSGTSNGSLPQGSLISIGTSLYGMTYQGGTNDKGAVFQLQSDGTSYANVLDFSGTSNGGFPYGSLISDGTFLYGMTSYGGVNGVGLIFKTSANSLPAGVPVNKLDTDVNAFPNPCASHLIIQTKKNFVNATITLYNADSRQLKQIKNISGRTVTLFRDNLACGMYLLELMQEDKIIYRSKVIIVD
jgi:uncharacterized repeat protein (TIGR03803 family)